LRGVYRLEEIYAAQGYFDAQANLGVTVDAATRRARVVYRIEPGIRWQVGAVRVEGLGETLPEATAVAALRARPGEPYRATTVRADEDRLQRFLTGKGFRQAAVEVLPETRDAARHAVDLAYRVVLGPRFELEVVGADRRQLEKRDLLPFLGEAGYDEALLLQTVAQIRAYYQERGYYRVDVRTEERRQDDVLHLRLEVVPGPKLTLEEVEFEGNASFPAERLARLMTTSPRRLLLPKSGRLVDEELAADLSNLRSFYALQGFSSARIGPARVTENGDRLRLTVPVAEGARQLVASLDLEGVVSLDRERLARRLPLAPGGPFHRVLLDETLAATRAAYEAEGFRSAVVSGAVEWNAERTLAAVRVRVIEGQRSGVEAVVLRGTQRTRPEVVRRVVGLEPGDPVSTAGLLEVQRKLYGLGLFSRVDVTAPTLGPTDSGGEVLVEVEEGRTRSIAYGAGYDSESGARGLLRLSEVNLFGRGLGVSLEVLAAERDQIYRLSYRQPYLGRSPLELRASVYREAEDRPAFDVLRRGVQVSLQRAFEDLRVWLAYDYRIVDLESFEPRAEIPRESLNARVASLAPTFLYDRRDDPIDPRRGWSANGQFEYAAPVFDATADFTKLFGQVTGLIDLRRWGTVAASVRAGAIENHRELSDAGQSPIDQVPVSERFFAGGRTTHRAFARDELGIPGETLLVTGREDVTSLGGGALLLGNLEWRFPIAGPVGGTLFSDVGQVWREAGDVRPADLRWGAGVGVRYLSPIGPIRLEIGWKLDREPFEAPMVWFFSLGNPF
jgi:outer membrane protein insertion porin family